MKNQVLVVEDDIINMRTVSLILKKHGFNILKAKNGEETFELLKYNKIIAVILDLNLPDISGLEILTHIRNHPIHKNCAILIVTVKNDKLDCILGLEMGADDYITKPFHHRELVARLNSAIRRAKTIINREGPIITLHDLKIYTEKRIIKKGNKITNLSFKEFEILYLLASNPGKVIDRNTILDRIGGIDYCPDTRVVDMHISSIRKKLGDTKNERHYIDTVSGIGYRFRE